jgi:hypothetical protein
LSDRAKDLSEAAMVGQWRSFMASCPRRPIAVAFLWAEHLG